jgi:hypothetical protein
MNKLHQLNKNFYNLNKKGEIISDLQNFLDNEAKTSRLGSSISQFQILSEIGKGSYGTVFKVKSY